MVVHNTPLYDVCYSTRTKVLAFLLILLGDLDTRVVQRISTHGNNQ